jgi:hypothetical protein
MATVDLGWGGIASSGDYERCIVVDGVRYGHILNPKTGWPVQGLTSVSVMASHCLIAGTASTVAAGTKLPAPWGSTEQVIAGLDPREGQIAGFFRWHDSGDVNVGTKPKLWLGYVRAIRNVAKAFPAVLFWLPTRTFEIEPMRKALVNAAQDAPNLTIRPSAYMTCDPPPVVPGLAAGTAVLEIEKKKPLPTTVDDLGRRAWACPVYTTKGADNCLDAGCRTCWIRPDVPVWYAFH